MNVSVDGHWEGFVERVVRDGRFASANEVVREGLRLIEERETRLQELRTTLDASIAAGEHVGEDEIDDALAVQSRALAAEGYATDPA